MADSPNTISQLSGLLKDCYPEGIVDVIPYGCHLQEDIKFVAKAQQTGNLYHGNQ